MQALRVTRFSRLPALRRTFATSRPAAHDDSARGYDADDGPRTRRYDNRSAPRLQCHTCGSTAHLSRACPRGARCFVCGGEGHVGRECPRGSMCFNCGQTGHMAQACPRPQKWRACYNCGGEGHVSRECPEPRQKREREHDGGGEWPARREHGDADRPSYGAVDRPPVPRRLLDKRTYHSDYERQMRKCHNCGEEGHIWRQCPEPRRPRDRSE